MSGERPSLQKRFCGVCEAKLPRSRSKYCSDECMNRARADGLFRTGPASSRVVPVERRCIDCGDESRSKRSPVRCRSCLRNYEISLWLDGDVSIVTYPSGEIKKWARSYVLDGLDACELCHTRGVKLQLDHVNGNAADHRRENLRGICVPCDSDLPTYRNRNSVESSRYRRRLDYIEARLRVKVMSEIAERLNASKLSKKTVGNVLDLLSDLSGE